MEGCGWFCIDPAIYITTLSVMVEKVTNHLASKRRVREPGDDRVCFARAKRQKQIASSTVL